LFLNVPGFNTVREYPNNNVENEETIMDENIEIVSDNPNNSNLHSSIDPSYLKRMDRHSLVHCSKYDFDIGDKVMVAKDFDTNVKTKKSKMSSFFSSEVEIVEILSNNKAKVKKGNECEIVQLSRLKRTNKKGL
jgi:hypothetical protein